MNENYISSMGKKLILLFKEAAKEWKKENPLFLGAGISFYVILSLGPIIVLMLFLLGNIFSEERAINQFLEQIRSVAGSRPAEIMGGIIKTATTSSMKPITIISSIPLIFFGSTMIFFQLKYALNIIFEHKDNNDSSIKEIVKKYSLSFLMLLIVASLFLLLVAKAPILNIFKDYLNDLINIPWILFRIIEILFSFGLLVILFMMIYIILPDRKMNKSDIFMGSLVTAVFFSFVQYLVGINAENTQINNALGALGSFTILILWVFYSSLVFLFGAAFTKVISGKSKRT